MAKSKKLTSKQQEELLAILAERFERYPERHPTLDWSKVHERILLHPTKSWSLHEMERTGGEPDVIGQDRSTGELVIVDCSAESPIGRRSLCFDHQAWESRKEAKPKSSAVVMAKEIGIELLTEEQYRFLQTLGKFDLKTSSWIATPANIRKLGGAVFCDRRYDTVFLYHNGAESYYASRGFRGMLKI